MRPASTFFNIQLSNSRVDVFRGFSSMYGSLTTIMLIMMWMYFCMYIILIGAYLNRYFRPVNRVLVNHASSKSELARENRRRIREIKKIQRRKKHYTEIDRNPKGQDENLTDRN